MGQFSFIAGDTNRAVRNNTLGGDAMCKMIAPDGREWCEEQYDGYGLFGQKDIYELVAELNSPELCTGDEDKDRLVGISLVFQDNPDGDFTYCESKGMKMPRLAHNMASKYGDLKPTRDDPNQGWGEE